MKEIRHWPILFALFLAFFSGCAPFFYQRIPESFKRPTECQAFFDQLDARVIEAGVKDASGYSVHGFPYLRTNRFLSALKGKVKEEKEKEQWLRWMQELDLKAREKEISTLPHNILPVLGPGLYWRKSSGEISDYTVERGLASHPDREVYPGREAHRGQHYSKLYDQYPP